jgi:hypothetical protein
VLDVLERETLFVLTCSKGAYVAATLLQQRTHVRACIFLCRRESRHRRRSSVVCLHQQFAEMFPWWLGRTRARQRPRNYHCEWTNTATHSRYCGSVNSKGKQFIVQFTRSSALCLIGNNYNSPIVPSRYVRPADRPSRPCHSCQRQPLAEP